jgi:hypothetical protein
MGMSVEKWTKSPQQLLLPLHLETDIPTMGTWLPELLLRHRSSSVLSF